MNSKNFQPILFISIGDKSCYYTLRETYLHEQWVGGQGGYMGREVRSFHHKNLSQDLDEAIAKAEAYGKEYGIPIKIDREALAAELNDIKRATAEQMAERERRMLERQAEWEQERQERDRLRRETVLEGKFPFGPYIGKPFLEAPVGYLNWIMSTEFDEGSMMAFLRSTLLDRHSDLILPVPDKNKLVGEPGKRMTFEVIVVKAVSFDRTSYTGYGWERVYITTMVTSNGECLVCFSTGFCEAVGDKLKIKATVKEHSEYDGQAQTVIQRVKVID